VGSHISAVVRPFSTVFRLLSLVAYTGLDALRSTPSRDIPREPPPPVNDGPGMDLAVWEDRLDEITRSRASMGNMELLIGGEEFFPRLERTVADARSSVEAPERSIQGSRGEGAHGRAGHYHGQRCGS
jgi:hypothetical protein